jgi:hypothetical protein
MCTHPECDLRWHLESSCTLPNLRHGNYDFVVIQQKAHPFDGSKALIELGTALIKEIQATHAIPVLFSTWSEKNNPAGQEVIDKAHNELYSQCEGVQIARCGTAWHKLRGVMDLYAPDGEHQNSRGAYLNACVMAKTIFGIDPLSLPDEIDFRGLTKPLKKDEIQLLHKTANIPTLSAVFLRL